MPRKTKAQRIAELMAPPPPLEFTLAELEKRSVVYPGMTKARQRTAIRDSHNALAEVLRVLESYSKHPSLVARSTVEAIHKNIRRALKLPDPPREEPSKSLWDLNELLGLVDEHGAEDPDATA